MDDWHFFVDEIADGAESLLAGLLIEGVGVVDQRGHYFVLLAE